MNFPSKLVENAVEQLSSLPGIGRKSALRLVLHMLKKDKLAVEQFGDSFIQLINRINYCTRCYSISDTELCEVCANPKRDKQTICVVEDIRVMMAIENTMQYKGVYHILGGLISPMDGIGPTDIRVEELIKKIENENIQEVIFALSTTMEGDTTNYYLFRRLKDSGIKISSIARGIAIGDELEYTDEITLGTAISSRMPYSE
ncbi:MAG: recombination protein RecR [Flavobacteriales bacterium]|jgi:recombination protein RecR|nr:recombination protein RecR [Flavobacteriales bacterium]MBT5274284.1 recombination protein RecR [Flavobacteriales bacterium]MBT6964637.1 recombination protein RecR [Flavobacteriales bacterium]